MSVDVSAEPAARPVAETRPPAPPQTRVAAAARRALRHAYVLPVFAIVLIVFAWVVTYGDWRLFDAEDYGQYYDALAGNLLHGRLDVPLDVIRGEAFIRDGKYYGYFGVAPALLRLPLRFLLPSLNGRSSRAFMLIACGLNVLYAYRTVLLLRAARAGSGADRVGSGRDEGPIPSPLYSGERVRVRGSVPDQHSSSINTAGATPLTPALSPEYRGEGVRRSPEANDIPVPTSAKAIVVLFLLAVGLGSAPLFLASRSYVYHEATMWAATAGLACGYYLLRYLLRPTAGSLVAAGVAAFFSFFSRPTTGSGCLLGIVGLAVLLIVQAAVRGRAGRGAVAVRRVAGWFGAESPLPGRHAVIAAGFAVFIVAAYFAMNYAKFRTLDGVPVRLYVQYIEDPHRMAVTGGKQIHLVNFRTDLLAYLRPGAVEFRPTFPWVFMTQQQHVYPEARIDAIEPAASLPVAMPALLLLACVGAVYILARPASPAGRLKLPAAALLAGGAIIFVTVGITQRYHNDLLPFLVLAGAAGVTAMASARRASVRVVCVILLAPLTLASVWVNLAFALEYQRVICWGVPAEKRAAYRQFRSAVDSLFGQAEPLEVVYTDDDQPPANATQPGQLWVVNGTNATYWYNGQEWVPVRPGKASPKVAGEIHLRMKLSQWRPGDDEPLVTTGKFEAGDVVYLRHVAPGQVAFGYDHWGVGGKVSRALAVELDRWYDLVIQLDRLNEQVVIRVDGRTVLKEHTALFPAPPEQTTIGRNDIGGWPPGPEPFTGTLVRVAEEP